MAAFECCASSAIDRRPRMLHQQEEEADVPQADECQSPYGGVAYFMIRLMLSFKRPRIMETYLAFDYRGAASESAMK